MNLPVTHVVILAAGQGTRMKSQLPKVLHPVAGRPMVEHVLDTAAAVAPATVTVVVGHAGEIVRSRLSRHTGLQFAVQEPQLGTAHALQQAESLLAGKNGTVILLSGDVPMLTGRTLQRLVATHTAANAAATVVTASVERPYGYGRIVRVDGQIARIVEERDASPAERQIREINSGIYAFDLAPLFEALRSIASQNAQGEFYLTDLVGIYRRRKLPVETLVIDNPKEIRGVNSRTELAEVSRLVRQTKNEELMAAGVTIVDPATTYIDPRADIGADTVIDRVTINSFCVIVESEIADGAAVGPFAHLRPASQVGEGAKVGNFVELKKTVLGARSKVSHLAYIGDAIVGPDVNIGAGTITCNYDGEKKHQTVIEEGAFIGSDSQLVAPVRIGKGAYVAAGSSITQDVPGGALGIARARQANVEGWAERKKAVPQKG
jgi:bifunctional UDP-N-acetylglucosamine pyrophosphorylase/glucosamine-1-phosphate N-acetyltransferase